MPSCPVCRSEYSDSAESCPRCAVAPPLPKRIGRYDIVERVGEGAAGFVYRAVDSALQRTVAVKVLHPTTHEHTVHRFLREARVVAGLRHPHIVAVHEAGTHEGLHYLIMEFIRGKTFEHFIDGGTMPLMDRLQIVRQVCQGVAEAHRHRIVHRDLKPSNIMVEDSGRAVVTDFGLARAIESETKVTRTGTVMGTPGYMAPEQVRGLEADMASDVFSLGAILYEAVTGKLAFYGKTDAEIYDRILNVDPEPPRKANPSIHADLETIIGKALDKDPLRRYESAVELSDDLTRFLAHEPIRARKVSVLHRTVRFLRRQKLIFIPLAAAVVMAGIIGSVWFIQTSAQRNRRDRDVAELLQEAELADDPAAAEELFVRALALDPAREEALKGRDRARALRESAAARLAQAVELIQKFDLAQFLPPHDIRKDVEGKLAAAIGLLDGIRPASTTRFVRGQALWRMGKFQEAVELLQAEPKGAASFELGQLYLEWLDRTRAEEFYSDSWGSPVSGSFAQKAVECLRQAGEHEREHAAAQVDLLQGRLGEAEKTARALAEQTRDRSPVAHARALAVWAEALFEQGRHAECLKILAELKGLRRSHAMVYVRSAQMLFRIAHRRSAGAGEIDPLIDQGLADLDVALKVEPGSAVVHNMAGVLLWTRVKRLQDEGKDVSPVLDAARARFALALERRPEYGTARLNACSMDVERVRRQFAAGHDPAELCGSILAATDELRRKDPASPFPVILAGAAVEYLGRQKQRRGEDPRDEYRRALRLYDSIDPAPVEARINRAVTALALAEFEHERGLDPESTLLQVEADCDRVLEADAGSIAARVNRGVARMIRAERLLAEGRDPESMCDRAIEDFTSALSMHGRHVQARVNRGICHGIRGTYRLRSGRDPVEALDRAIEDYDECVRFAPNAAMAHANLGSAILNREHFRFFAGGADVDAIDKGIRHSKRAGELMSSAAAYVNLTSLYLLRARVTKRESDLDRAEEAASEGIRIGPGYFQIYYSRAEVGRDRAALAPPDRRPEIVKRAVADLDACLERNRTFAQAHLLRGQLAVLHGGDLRRAVADLEEAVRCNPQIRPWAAPLLKQAKEKLEDPEY